MNCSFSVADSQDRFVLDLLVLFPFTLFIQKWWFGLLVLLYTHLICMNTYFLGIWDFILHLITHLIQPYLLTYRPSCNNIKVDSNAFKLNIYIITCKAEFSKIILEGKWMGCFKYTVPFCKACSALEACALCKICSMYTFVV